MFSASQQHILRFLKHVFSIVLYPPQLLQIKLKADNPSEMIL